MASLDQMSVSLSFVDMEDRVLNAIWNHLGYAMGSSPDTLAGTVLDALRADGIYPEAADYLYEQLRRQYEDVEIATLQDLVDSTCHVLADPSGMFSVL